MGNQSKLNLLTQQQQQTIKCGLCWLDFIFVWATQEQNCHLGVAWVWEMLMISIGHRIGRARWNGTYKCQAEVDNETRLAGFQSKPWHSLIVREASGRLGNLTKSISVIYKVVMIVQVIENSHWIFRLLNSMLIWVFYLIQQPICPFHHDSPFYNDVGTNQNRICEAIGCVPGI